MWAVKSEGEKEKIRMRIGTKGEDKTQNTVRSVSKENKKTIAVDRQQTKDKIEMKWDNEGKKPEQSTRTNTHTHMH